MTLESNSYHVTFTNSAQVTFYVTFPGSIRYNTFIYNHMLKAWLTADLCKFFILIFKWFAVRSGAILITFMTNFPMKLKIQHS